MVGLLTNAETLLRKAVGIRKAGYELAAEDFKAMSKEIRLGRPPSAFLKTVQRKGNAYRSGISAYQQALLNLEAFLIAEGR